MEKDAGSCWGADGMSEIRNAKIKTTFLGVEDHGIFTSIVHLEWEGAGQGFGMYNIGGKFPSNMGTKFLRELLEVVGVEKWEDLPGTFVRVKSGSMKIHAIGHIIKDRWFSPEEFFAAERAMAEE